MTSTTSSPVRESSESRGGAFAENVNGECIGAEVIRVRINTRLAAGLGKALGRRAQDGARQRDAMTSLACPHKKTGGFLEFGEFRKKERWARQENFVREEREVFLPEGERFREASCLNLDFLRERCSRRKV